MNPARLAHDTATGRCRDPVQPDSNYVLRGSHRKCAFGATRTLQVAPHRQHSWVPIELSIRPPSAESTAQFLLGRDSRLRRAVPGAGARAGSRVSFPRWVKAARLAHDAATGGCRQHGHSVFQLRLLGLSSKVRLRRDKDAQAAPHRQHSWLQIELCVRSPIAGSTAQFLLVRDSRLRRAFSGAGARAGSRVRSS